MPKVIGVRFKTSPRVYWFSPGDDEYTKNMTVVVETQRGMELATVVELPHDVEENKLVSPLKPVVRVATKEDLEADEADSARKQSIIATAKERVAAHGLDMKVVDCEFTVDHSKLVLYFTAENRVDFRELVRDLASTFHIRIDLRQIGARDECKLIGSLGPCGLPCCCGRFESDSEHVSIKMAKNQNLALTPGKINGMCGRLLCCLGYENKTYEEIIKRAPKHGAFVTLPDGRRGTVVSLTPLTEVVRVRVGDEENFEFVDCKLNELKGFRSEEQKPAPDQPKEGGEKRRERNDRGDKGERSNPNKEKQKNRPDNGGNKSAGENNPNGDGDRHGKNRKHKRGGRDRRPKPEGKGEPSPQ